MNTKLSTLIRQCLSALGCMCVVTSATAKEPVAELYGAVSYPSYAVGMYKIPVDKYQPTLIKNQIYASGSGVAIDNTYYGIHFEMVAGIPVVSEDTYSTSDWSNTGSYTGDLTAVATAVAYSYERNQTFGCFYNEDGQTFNFSLYTPSNFSHTIISQLPKPWSGCGFDSQNRLWAIDCDGDLFTVNIKTGEQTYVGPTGVTSDWITGAIIDPAIDVMYWSVKNETEAAMYKVDLSSAKATRLYTLENEEQLGGFYIPRTAPNAAAPAKARGLTVSFSGISKSGTVSFRTPATTYDGNTASGDITYHIYANGKEVATGETTYNLSSWVKVGVDVDDTDTYCIAVTFSNENGEGPRYTTSKYIGPDTPVATSGAGVASDANGIKVSWYSVSSGINNGNIDTDNLTYRVTRFPDNVVVYEGAALSYIDKLEMPEKRTNYYYSVECICGDLISAPRNTASFAYGPYEPEFTETFDSKAALIGWSSINAEGTSRTWTYSSNAVQTSTSASGKAADLWFMSTAVRLEKGKVYNLTIDARSYSAKYFEQIEVKYGSEATIDGMTEIAMESTSIASTSYKTYTGSISPKADGIYYIGIHSCAEKSYYTYIDNIGLSKGVILNAPAAVTDLTAIPEETGVHKASISFTVPEYAISGDKLTEPVNKVELYRDDDLIVSESIEADQGGKTYTIVDDQQPTAGDHTYSVICYNENGQGDSASTTAYIGFYKPVTPDSIDVAETENLGEVKISWSAVTADITDKILSDNDVTYNIYDRNSNLIAENVTGTEYTTQAISDDSQAFVRYFVEAVSEGGVSDRIKSGLVPVGTAYTSPYRESFTDAKLSTIMGMEILSGSEAWSIVSSDDTYHIAPSDNDGGMSFLEGYANTVSAIFTGKIDLNGLNKPALSFKVYNFGGSAALNSQNELEVQINDGTGFKPIETVIIGQTGELEQWNKVIVPLDDYYGQVIRIKFIASVKDIRFFYLDDIRITNECDDNLFIKSISAPSIVDPDQNFNIKVTVENAGNNNAKGFRVLLYQDDEIVDQTNGLELASEAEKVVTFTRQHNILEVGDIKYHAEVEYETDQLPLDNISEPFVVTVKSNSNPIVHDLTAEDNGQSVALSWSNPDMSEAAPESTIEDFESADPWTSDVNSWTFLDLDKGFIGAIGKKQMPITGQQSFFVFDSTNAIATGDAFKGHSGNQYLCSMYSLKGDTPVQNDDWAISPKLYGKAQTISFYASSFLSDTGDNQYYESFEILYSTTGTDPEDFKVVEQYKNIPATWIKYSAYLPDGAKYFAIRAVSNYQYMLFIDDVEFIAANSQPREMHLKGFNVYRNNSKINTTLVTEGTYTDVIANRNTNSIYNYCVTAVYEEGESLSSNVVTISKSSSIDDIATGCIKITTSTGTINIVGATGKLVQIYAIDGRIVASGIADNVTGFSVANGIYLVKIDNQTTKVLVK